MPNRCTVLHLGLIEYTRAMQLQNSLAAEIATGAQPACLLLLEHPHTYTFGRRGQAKNLLWDADELARRAAAVHWVDRGGDVTYHGPGQLVGYPLLPLGAPVAFAPANGSPLLPQADYVGYVRRLEKALVIAMENLGVAAHTLPGMTGVWVKPAPDGAVAKIAAIGVKVDARGVTRHGFALNVHPDMSYWQGIIACGLTGYAVTSLAELVPRPPEMEVVVRAVIVAFAEIFDYHMVEEQL
jgi:lipoyl(octanoyl) transferase